MAAAIAFLSITLSGHGAGAQTTIKIVVPAQPGGAGDTLACWMGEQIGLAQGQTVLIENRSRAGYRGRG